MVTSEPAKVDRPRCNGGSFSSGHDTPSIFLGWLCEILVLREAALHLTGLTGQQAHRARRAVILSGPMNERVSPGWFSGATLFQSELPIVALGSTRQCHADTLSQIP